MKLERTSGLLLHISSLGGVQGIGSLGQQAFRFVDFLNETGTTYWQILPIHPVVKKFGYSPYASTSTYAGNPLFIDPFKLKDKYSFLPDYSDRTHLSDFINFDLVVNNLDKYFREAVSLFIKHGSEDEIQKYEQFCRDESHWLDDFALFTAISEEFNDSKWLNWDKDIAFRENKALETYREKLNDEIMYQSILQYFFFNQWAELKKYCVKKNIKIIGDVPIYVGFNSADVWASPEIFSLDEDGFADPVAGVPPDYFSATGQRWGNPLYKWFDSDGRLNKHTLEWWVKRLKHQLDMVDIIRLDHFRAFESYWAIPKTEKTAINGEWIKGPGIEFFKSIEKAIGDLPLIAEDLGIITKEVRKLRDDLKLPGMKILQFAFDFTNDNTYLPHSITEPNSIVYTGTHDNDTTNGWYYESGLDQAVKDYLKFYLNIENDDRFHQKFIKVAMMSVAKVCVIPIQDLLGYGSHFRMNTPGTLQSGNWNWMLKNLDEVWHEKNFWMQLNKLYNRIPKTTTDQ
jgi:4-alpha-glucanotransferase